ncbi:hypothetical protein E6U81_31735 [Streptomyces sp. A0592]|nr:hypothetical protein E6U81_31735 [Streptomyces sp. A0592]
MDRTLRDLGATGIGSVGVLLEDGTEPGLAYFDVGSGAHMPLSTEWHAYDCRFGRSPTTRACPAWSTRLPRFCRVEGGTRGGLPGLAASGPARSSPAGAGRRRSQGARHRSDGPGWRVLPIGSGSISGACQRACPRPGRPGFVLGCQEGQISDGQGTGIPVRLIC